MADDASTGSAMTLANQMKGLDSSAIDETWDHADEEQVPPSIMAGSQEEAALLQALVAKLEESGAMAEWLSFKESTAFQDIPLLCLRGRKYQVDRAAASVPRLVEMMREYRVGSGVDESLQKTIKAGAAVYLGSKDAMGRGVVWLRLRNHDPKAQPPAEFARSIAAVMLMALDDPEVQRLGIVILHDMNGIRLKNMNPPAFKLILSKVLPTLPIRVARVCIINPPWIIGKVVMPIVLAFVSKKIKSRIQIFHGPKGIAPSGVHGFVPPSSIPEELGGEWHFDFDKWLASADAA